MTRSVALALIIGTMAVAACSDDSDAAAVPAPAATPPPRLGPELITASGFDGSVGTEWVFTAEDPGQIARIARDADGNAVVEMSAELDDAASWPQVVQQGRMPLISGKRYRLALRARSDGFGLVFTSVAFEDAAGTEFLAVGPGSLTVDSPDWTEYHFDFEAPGGTAAGYVVLRLALNTAMTDEPFLSAQVDDVSLRRIEG